MASRSLSAQEQALARSVFGSSLELSQIEISDGLGFGDRPWTLCGTSCYTIHLGPKGFQSALAGPTMPSVLIHELTHCWQGQNGLFGFGFMVSSCISQAASVLTNVQPTGLLWPPLDSNCSRAYDYQPGQDWTDYNCEQQAHIVEDWFDRGCTTFDPCYRYVRDNIRRGNTGPAGVPQSAEATMQIDGPRTLIEGQSATGSKRWAWSMTRPAAIARSTAARSPASARVPGCAGSPGARPRPPGGPSRRSVQPGAAGMPLGRTASSVPDGSWDYAEGSCEAYGGGCEHACPVGARREGACWELRGASDEVCPHRRSALDRRGGENGLRSFGARL